MTTAEIREAWKQGEYGKALYNAAGYTPLGLVTALIDVGREVWTMDDGLKEGGYIPLEEINKDEQSQ